MKRGREKGGNMRDKGRKGKKKGRKGEKEKMGEKNLRHIRHDRGKKKQCIIF
jgi:hypothetical protein